MPISVIAGGAGFVGSHLCDRMLSDGHEVVCVDNLITGSEKNISHLESDHAFTFINHDIRQPIENISEADFIFNLASPASPVDFSKYPIEILQTASQGTFNLLQLAQRTGARFLLASTSEVYGDPLEHPQTETYLGNVNPIGIRSVYDEAKRYAEAMTKAYERKYDQDVRIARIFNTYGPRMRPDDGRVVSNFIVQALASQPITVYGDGTQTRSFQYADDLVEGLVRLMNCDYTDPVNIGNPAEYTVKDLAEIILKMTESDSEIIYEPLPADDPKKRRPNISLAKEKLAWEPKIPVEEGLQKTIDYFAAM